MMERRDAKKRTWTKETVSRILRAVPHPEGFHFFKGIGDPTGKVALSLADFVEHLRAVDIRSVNFHFERQDFEKWIRDVLGDIELSRRIDRIRKELRGEMLRNEIVRIVKERLEELRGMQAKS